MPSPAKTPAGGTKRGRPPTRINTSLPTLSSPNKKKGRPSKSSSPKAHKASKSPASPTKRPRGRPPKSKAVSSNTPASFFDLGLPPPPPPPPPVNNPFYQKFVKDYWQNFYIYNHQSAAVMNIPGIIPSPMSPAVAENLASKPPPPAAAAAAKSDKGDKVESTCV